MAGFLLLLGFSRGASLYMMPMGWFVVCALLIIGRTIFSMERQMVRLTKKQGSPGLLIYGANEAGMALANWVTASSSRIRLPGFLTDDQEQIGQRVHGVRVLGSERDLPTILKTHQIEEIWMMFTPDHIKRHRLRTFCQQNDIKLVILPELEPFRRFVPPSHTGETGSNTVNVGQELS